MTCDIFYNNEIELVLSSVVSDFSDFVIIGDESSYLFKALNDVFGKISDGSFGKTCVVSILYGSDNKTDILRKTKVALSQNNCQRCVVCDENSLPVSEKGYYIAEREYMLLADKTQFNEIKAISGEIPTVLLVCDEIIGPGQKMKKNLSFDNNRIEITDEDCKINRGYAYIRDVLSSILMAANKLREGNIYNVSSFSASDCIIKQNIHQLFSEKFTLQCMLNTCHSRETKALCSLKIKSAGLSVTEMKTALHLTFSSHFGLEYDYDKNLPQYCSKLEILKRTEIEILKEIDRICKENDISYFLTGGSLLGAVRYGRSIPWDDDLDIGMLRKDFDKFRKICPAEIDKSKYVFSSRTTEGGYRNPFDKVRLKNTYFSTGLSAEAGIQDGVFVDIFVYDTTSQDKRLQNLHLKLIKTAYRFFYIKREYKIDNSFKGYRLTRIIRPFVKLIPLYLLRLFSDKALILYEKKKTDYLIDGTGLNINRGAFRKSCVDELTEMEFEGIKVPVPVNYDAFLKHIYGDNYLEEPAIFKRTGTHDFYRLDLGEYITDEPLLKGEQSLDGELY